MEAQTDRKRGYSPKNADVKDPKRNKTDDLELVRLLHTMENSPAPGGISWQQLESRARLCQQLYEKSSDKSLKSRVEAACKEANEASSNLKARDAHLPNPIEKIFQKNGTATKVVVTPEKSSRSESSLSGKTKGISDEKIAVTKLDKIAVNENKSTDAIPSTRTNVADLQKQQREQMEAAVAQMAAQMKDQTSQLHSTIKGQTDGLLDTMENITAQNVVDVAEVAAAAQEQVKRNWRRAAATWTVFFTIVGAFLGTMFTIYMVPKVEMQGFISAMCAGQQANKVCLFLSETFGARKASKHVLPSATEHLENSLSGSEPVPVSVKADPQNVRYSLQDAALAIARGDSALLLSVLQEEPNLVNKQDTNGWTLLHEAAWNGRVEIAEILLRRNWNKNLINAAGQTALDIAYQAYGQVLDHPMIRLLAPENSETIDINARGEQHEIKVPDGVDADKLRVEALREYSEMQAAQQSPLESGREELQRQERIEQERLDREQREQERLERDQLEQEQHEKNRLEQEQREQERLEQAQQEQEWLEQEQWEQERLEQEQREQERLEQEQRERDQREQERRELDQREQERREQVLRLEHELLQQEQERQEHIQQKPFRQEQQEEAQHKKAQAFPILDGQRFSGRDLRRAATRGDVGRLEAFLSMNIDFVDEQDQNQWTALHLAIRSGHTNIVKLLLEAGADTKIRNNLGMTAIELAMYKLGDDHEIVSLLDEN